MKTTISVELEPLRVPNYVLVKGSTLQGDEERKFHVKDLDATTLDALCGEYKRELFKKAGKRMPETMTACYYCDDCPRRDA